MPGALPQSLNALIKALTRFPGIGEKSATRMVLHILRNDRSLFSSIGEAFLTAGTTIAICKRCFNVSESDTCEICSDEQRENGTVCVVEDVGDLISIEKSGRFKGKYHILCGVVSPMEGKSFEDLTTKELKNSVLSFNITEVIIALNPTVEGEATALYLKEFLADTGVKITRLACGIPVGSDIEYLDELTMAMALEGRRDID